MTDPPELQLARQSVNAALSVANSSMSLIARGRKEAASLRHDHAPSKIAAIRNQAEQGNADAQYTLAEELSRTTVLEGGKFLPNPSLDEAEAVHWYRLAAEQGHREAQYELGSRYAKGEGVPKDETEATCWLSRAADLGHLFAIIEVVDRDFEGIDAPLDRESSVRLRLRGADTALVEPEWDDDARITAIHWGAEIGHVASHNFLGDWYRTDHCWPTPRNYGEAAKWYKLAAEQGNASAQFNLGNMYVHGRGVPQDDKEALRWYRLAAEQGHASAQSNLGVMYEYGVPQDYKEALRWYRLAAEQDHASGQNNLGNMYVHGRGVPQDDKEALRWYRLAAEQGYSIAQVNLGNMYSNGRGLPQDYVRAHMWFNLAGSVGDPDGVKNRDTVAANMTPAQVAEAQQLARDWKPTTAK